VSVSLDDESDLGWGGGEGVGGCDGGENGEEGGGRAEVVRAVARDDGGAAIALGSGLMGAVAAALGVEFGFGAVEAGVATRSCGCKGLREGRWGGEVTEAPPRLWVDSERWMRLKGGHEEETKSKKGAMELEAKRHRAAP
jgi:hypothetical protein